MKKWKWKVTAILLAGALLAGCGSARDMSATADTYTENMQTAGATSKGDYYNGADMASDDIYESAEADYDDADYAAGSEEAGATGTAGSEVTENVAAGRKLIKRVELSVETQEFDSLISRIESRVTELGGYVEQSSIGGNSFGSSSSSRSASYSVRIPVDKLDRFVNAVAEVSNVTNKTQTASDVTLEYVDTKSRLDALKIEQERMMQLLEQAEDLETIVGLEQRLTEIRYELQNYESRIRTLDNLVDFATINVTIREVQVYTPTVTPEKSDWERMVEGFVVSVKDVANGIKNFFIGLVIALPYLIVWGLIIGGIILFIVKRIKGSAKRREKKQAKREAKRKAQEEKKAAKQKERQENQSSWGSKEESGVGQADAPKKPAELSEEKAQAEADKK